MKKQYEDCFTVGLGGVKTHGTRNRQVEYLSRVKKSETTLEGFCGRKKVQRHAKGARLKKKSGQVTCLGCLSAMAARATVWG